MLIAPDCASCVTSSRPVEFRHHVDATSTREHASAHHGALPPFPTGELDQDGDSHTTLDELVAGLLGTAPVRGLVGDAWDEGAMMGEWGEGEGDSSDDDRQIGSPSVSFRHPKVH